MKKKITILPGDGIGKEVTACGKKILEQVAECFGHEFIFDEALIGHEAIELTGNPLPDETLAKLKNSDAILFGAVVVAVLLGRTLLPAVFDAIGSTEGDSLAKSVAVVVVLVLARLFGLRGKVA